MPFAENENVIQTLAPDRTDEALGERILLRAVRRCEDFVDLHALHSGPKLLAVDLVTVAQEIGRRGVVLLYTASCCRVRSNTPTRCDPISPYSLWIGCYGKQNIRLIVRIIRGYSKHRVNDAVETLHGLIITQE